MNSLAGGCFVEAGQHGVNRRSKTGTEQLATEAHRGFEVLAVALTLGRRVVGQVVSHSHGVKANWDRHPKSWTTAEGRVASPDQG